MENRMNDPRFKSYSRKAHPLADLFPMLDEQALKELAEDIKTNGQHQPIILSGELVVDGRNRLKACEMAGVMPDSLEKQFKDDAEIAKYIISQNIHRRHLTTSQRAAIAAEMANMAHGGDRKSEEIKAQKCGLITEPQAASMMNVSERSVQQAKSVKKSSPELFEKVKSGEMSVAAAERKLKPIEPDIKCPTPSLKEMAYRETGVLGEEEDREDDNQQPTIYRSTLPCFIDVDGDDYEERAWEHFRKVVENRIGLKKIQSNGQELQQYLNWRNNTIESNKSKE